MRKEIKCERANENRNHNNNEKSYKAPKYYTITILLENSEA